MASLQHPSTPNGRMIMRMAGTPAEAERLGREMEQFGDVMQDSARTLTLFANAQDGMHGLAIQTLRGEVGDSHTALQAAGEQYSGVGRAIRIYGSKAITLQSQIETCAENASTSWDHYLGLPGDKDGREYGSIFNKAPEAGSAEAEQHAKEDAEKQAAYDAWLEEARRFDGYYDDWEDAWVTAARDAEGEFADSLEDGFWDKVDEFVEGLQDVLSKIGLVVSILSIIFGGPLLALIASIVAIAALALTIYQFVRGDASGWDLAFAIAGVVPWGSVGKLGDGADGLKEFATDAVPKAFDPKAWKSAGEQVHTLSNAAAGAQGFWPKLSQTAKTAFNEGNPNGIEDVVSRYFTGKTSDEWDEALDPLFKVNSSFGEQYEAWHAVAKGGLKFDERHAEWTGRKSLKESLGPFGKMF